MQPPALRPLVAAARLAFVALAAGLLVSCNTPPKNEGWSGSRVDPSADGLTEIGGTDLRSKDLVAATDSMAMDIARRLDVVNRSAPPVIVVGQIENRTSQPARSYDIFLTRLRSQLNVAGTREGLDFVRERSFVEQQRDREFGGRNPAQSAMAYQSRAEYMLTGTVEDMPSGETNYYLMSFQLVQLVDRARGGPDVGAGAIVWENFYEVKFQPAANFR
ncbi:MAG TPA: hypothetical protein PKC43_02330 [Phycisphaerales bacterium]|nr:hypothetical protein [Phycisphaerales bacterium]HMP36262.1 hypothetical protein [Phycisphaerales bacterium]